MTLRTRFMAHPLAVLVLLLFIAYLLSADRLVVAYTALKGDAVVAPADMAESLPPVTRFSVDTVHTTPDTLLERVEASGWALPPEHGFANISTNFVLHLVFATRGALYRVPTVASKRPDLLDAFGLSDQTLSLGFSTAFTPVRMRGGVYRLGLIIRSGDRDIASAWTCKRFIQDRKGFRELVFDPSLVSSNLPESRGDMQAHAFDVFKSTLSRADLTGWAFANTGAASEDQSVYLVFGGESNAYSIATDKRSRPDLRTAFRAGMKVVGEDAGFFTSLNLAELPYGSYRLGVLIRERNRDVAFMWMPNRMLHSVSNGLVNVTAP
ncbi:MAG: hypothetical protein PHR35_13095 [Kiritimatiellae bacterium]|nr:hypothetical protein [Kiritimatiellia bacterium]